MTETDAGFQEVSGGNSMTLATTRSVSEHAWHILPHLRANARIFDYGCGKGAITLDLARRCPEGHVVGMDNVAESIEFAKASAQKAGLTNVEFRVGDDVVAELDAYEAESFDLVHAHQVMLHLPDPVRALREMRRLVKKGSGVVAVRDNVELMYVGASDMMLHHKEAMEKIMYVSPSATGPVRGRWNHVWMHEAGFDWDRMEMGTASWGVSGTEGRNMWVAGSKNAAMKLARMFETVATEEEVEQLGKDYDVWATKEHGRILALDSWVVGRA